MKRLIAMLLIFMIMVLNGCSENATVNTDSATDGNSLPEYTGEALIEADPDREVYVSLINQECDWYPDSWFGISFHIFTKEYYSPEDIQIYIPTEMQYEAEIVDKSEYFQRSAYGGVSGLGLEYQHFLYLNEVDWQEYARLLSDKTEAGEHIQAALQAVSPDWIEVEKWREVDKRFSEMDRALRSDYVKMQVDDIPKYYLYWVVIEFSEPYREETIEYVEFTLDGKKHSVDIGQWRFHEERPKEYLVNSAWVLKSKLVTLANLCTPYTGGYVRIPEAFSFTALADLTVTGVRMYGADVELLGGKVTNGTGVDYYWNADQPINVSKGTDFNMDVYLYDELFAEYESACTVYLVMDYEVDGASYSMSMPCLLARYNHPWDTCLMAFENYDMGEYYTYVYRQQQEAWVDEMPESWSR